MIHKFIYTYRIKVNHTFALRSYLHSHIYPRSQSLFVKMSTAFLYSGQLHVLLSDALPIIPSLTQPMPLNPFTTMEKPMVAPTILCVPETGSFRKVAKISQIQEPKRDEGNRLKRIKVQSYRTEIKNSILPRNS